MRPRSSMKSGTAASKTQGHLTKFTDDTATSLHFSSTISPRYYISHPPFCTIEQFFECTICHWHCMGMSKLRAHVPDRKRRPWLYSKKERKLRKCTNTRRQKLHVVQPVDRAKQPKHQNTNLSCVDNHALPSLEEPELRFASLTQCLIIQG